MLLLVRIAFLSGSSAVVTAVFSFDSAGAVFIFSRWLVIACLLCALGARIVSWMATKGMPRDFISVAWTDYKKEQLENAGLASRIAFIAQVFGALAAVLGSGVLASVLVFWMTRNIK